MTWQSSQTQHQRSSFVRLPLRILIVDDNEDTAKSLKEAVEDLGNSGSICITGRDAIAQTSSFRPDILLLDLSMPGIGGIQVAQTLRKDVSLSRLKIIAVTGSGDAATRKQTAAAGFDLHLTKPVRYDVVIC